MNWSVADRARAIPPTAITGLLRSFRNRVRIGVLDREDARPTPASSQEVARERRRELARFYMRFESHVETLCQAAQFGADGRRDEMYRADRAYLLDRYAELAPHLAAYLRPQADDAEIVQAAGGDGGDAIDALLSPGTLADFVAADDGAMIPRISRAREALILYGEQLRRLAAR